MTNWDNVVTDKELIKAKNMRKKIYIEEKQRKSALTELQGEGWEYMQDYADSKYVKVKKEKAYDEQFEDRIWMLFFQMGFTFLNKDRNFNMTYDYNNSDLTQQIDVFAVDDETILIVECKATKELKDGVFKKELEAFHGQMDGLRKCALKKFPGRKVKFIWAVHNYIMLPKDMTRIKEWKIIFFGDSIIQYYCELVKHLGTCARYQLLGNLLANTEIRNMQNKIPAIKGKMGGYDYYEFSIEPEKLLKIGYVLHRNEANKNMMPTYQRIIKKKRLKEVQTFVNNGGYFPNSIIISIDTKGRGLQFDVVPTKIEESLSKVGILHLPQRYHSAYIIDGQHRVYGYSDTEYAKTNTIPVVAFVDLERSEQLKLFMDINENQKAVSKTLRVTLSSDMLWDAPDFNDRREALRSKLAQMCGEEQTSPLWGRVVIGEDEKNPTKCITVEAIQQGLKKSRFFSLFGKNNNLIAPGSFDLGENQSTLDKFYPFLENCLKIVKKHCLEEWDAGEMGLLTINRGIQAIIRILDDIIVHLQAQQKINPRVNKTEELIPKVQYYLEPLLTYINELDDKQRKELKGFLGGGGDTKFWRSFQKVIAEARGDFQPNGLNEYIENETKQYNAASRDYLTAIKKSVKDKIKALLLDFYGDDWMIMGMPKSLYRDVQKKADDKNYELVKNNRGAEITKVNAWEFITLADCKKIVTYANNWSNIFENIITRPVDKNLSKKDEKTDWLIILSKEMNKMSRGTSYSVSKKTFDLIKSVYDWLIMN